MNDFMTKLYYYDHQTVTGNVKSDWDSDEFYIEIKENVVKQGEDSKVWLLPKLNREKWKLHT